MNPIGLRNVLFAAATVFAALPALGAAPTASPSPAAMASAMPATSAAPSAPASPAASVSPGANAGKITTGEIYPVASPSAKPAAPTPSPTPTPTPGPAFANMQWREIGPATAGGRVAAVAGTATDPKLYYIGAAGGGVWKSAQRRPDLGSGLRQAGASARSARSRSIRPTTTSSGSAPASRNPAQRRELRRRPLQDDRRRRARGRTWVSNGTRYISRILVDPRNHESRHRRRARRRLRRQLAIAASTSRRRRQDLEADALRRPESGASDLAMDVAKPERRLRGHLAVPAAGRGRSRAAATEDGLYKSTDGGERGRTLEGHGLPERRRPGRIGLAVAPSDGNRVYALIESKDGILWRTDDGGANWTMVSNDTLVDQRPFYFSHIAVDPKNREPRLRASREALAVSKDGGKTFKRDRRRRARRLPRDLDRAQRSRSASSSARTAATR